MWVAPFSSFFIKFFLRISYSALSHASSSKWSQKLTGNITQRKISDALKESLIVSALWGLLEAFKQFDISSFITLVCVGGFFSLFRSRIEHNHFWVLRVPFERGMESTLPFLSVLVQGKTVEILGIDAFASFLFINLIFIHAGVQISSWQTLGASHELFRLGSQSVRNDPLLLFNLAMINLWTVLLFLYYINKVVFVGVAVLLVTPFILQQNFLKKWRFVIAGTFLLTLPFALIHFTLLLATASFLLFPLIGLGFVFGTPMFFIIGLICLIAFGQILCLFPSTTPEEQKTTRDQQKKRVAVIGFGLSGILVTKELLEQGMEVYVFERDKEEGGVWLKDHGRIIESTKSTSSISNTLFTDFDYDWEKCDLQNIFTAKDFFNYLKRYVEVYEIKKKAVIHFGVDVTSVDKKGENWEVTSSVGTQCFDWVVAATGLNNIPRFPKWADPKKGKIIHSENFSFLSEEEKRARYQGKSVAVVGLGETASDVIADLCNYCSHCYVFVRAPTFILPRNLFNLPPDCIGEWRGLFEMPPEFRINTFTYFEPLVGILRWISSYDEDEKAGNSAEIADFTFSKWFVLLYLLHPALTGKNAIGSVTKSSAFFKPLKEGKVTIVPFDVMEYCNNSIKTVGKENFDNIDSVVCCTGFCGLDIPLLENLNLRRSKVIDRYLGIFYPELPNFASIGFVRAWIGSLPFGIQQQAKMIARVIAGKVMLPDSKSMGTKIVQQNTPFTDTPHITQASMIYGNYLARTFNQNEPSMLRLFFKDPGLWLRVMFSVFSPEVYSKSLKKNDVAFIPIWRNPLSLAQAPIYFASVLLLAPLYRSFWFVCSKLIPGNSWSWWWCRNHFSAPF